MDFLRPATEAMVDSGKGKFADGNNLWQRALFNFELRQDPARFTNYCSLKVPE